MQPFSYNSDLTSGSLQVRECRIVAELLLDQATPEQWDTALYEDNRLQKTSKASVKRIGSALRKRLELLEPIFWRFIRDGDLELATQTCFAATLERNLLLTEFIESIVADAFTTSTDHLAAWQWQDFLDERNQRDPRIAKWTESSRKKMGQVVFRTLAEYGLLSSNRTLKLQSVRVRPELRTQLEDSQRLRTLSCMSVAQPQRSAFS